VGRRHAIAVSNGTTALEAAVGALRLDPGDEVILPTFTIISCVAAILRADLKPVVVDCDANTWNMDVGKIEEKITLRTRAIMVVHIYGLPVDMGPIQSIAERYGLRIIEDASEMIGQTYRGKRCGSFGDISTFSFYPNKHITTGEGGMILTDDDELAERCRSLRNLCFKREKRFIHDELGYNFRMSNIQAALGVAQLERLEEFIHKKRYIGSLYRERLADVDSIELQPHLTEYAENIYWVFGLVLKERIPFDADSAMKRLSQRNIGTRPFFFPMHAQPVFRKMGLFSGEKHAVAERIARRGFYLPSGLALTVEQVDRSARELKAVLKN
jgi:perosamine synthetase